MVDQKNVLTKCILLLEKCPWNGTWVKPFHSGNVHRDIYIYIYSKPRCNTAIIDASSPCLRNCWGHNPESQRTFWRQGVETTKVRHKTKRVVESPKISANLATRETIHWLLTVKSAIWLVTSPVILISSFWDIRYLHLGWYPHHLIPSISAQIPSCWKRSESALGSYCKCPDAHLFWQNLGCSNPKLNT